MITRTTHHTLRYANTGKNESLMSLLAEWRRVMQLIADELWDNGYKWVEDGITHEFDVHSYKFELPKYLDYNRFNIDTWLSARMMSSLVTQLSGKLRGLLSKQSARVHVFDKNAGKGIFNEKLWERIENAMPGRPDYSDAGLEISSKCADFIETPGGKFYGYLRIKSSGTRIFKLPVCRQSRMHKFIGEHWNRCNGYLIDEYGIQLRWQKDAELRTDGTKLGADQGLKTVMSLSNGQVTPDLVISAPRKGDPDRKIVRNLDTILDKMPRKRKGSKAFKRVSDERKNFINYAIKRLNLDGVREIGLEEVVNIRYGKSSSRKMSHWSNPIIRDSLIRVAEELGVRVTLQSSAYRSQRCSGCGLVRKASSKGKIYSCPNCGLIIDADINAARNHEIELPEIPRCNTASMLARTKGFLWYPDGLFLVDGSEFRVPDTHKA